MNRIRPTRKAGSTCQPRRIAAALLLATLVFLPALPASPLVPGLKAQHAAFRVKGRVTNERGEPMPDADVRLEAFYGYAAGTFAGPRLLSTKTNAKGDWSVGALQPGIWLFEVFAANHIPESVALPIRILTTVSMGTSGMALTWDLLLKPVPAPDDVTGHSLREALAAARDGKADVARTALAQIPTDPTADYLAGAARIALVARDMSLAQTLFKRAFDATRGRTHDKDEQKFLSAAIGDLATIKVR